MNTRKIAAEVLYKVIYHKKTLNEVLPIIKKQMNHPQEFAFVQAILYGVLRLYPRLLFIVNQLLQKPIKPKDSIIFQLLCIGLYQLIEMRIPDHAAISETVEAARGLQKPHMTGLVNAVLRNFLRNKPTLLESVNTDLEAKYAHPKWLIESIQNAYPDDAHDILNANNQAPPFSLRVNLNKISREDYLLQLSKQNIEAKAIPFTKSGVELQTAQDVFNLPGFAEGLLSVQDGAAQFATELLQLKPNIRVLDACAAPGGKAAHILEHTSNLELVAIDISKKRIKLIEENLQRLKLKATCLCQDASKPTEWWDKKLYDRILVDAPCSGTGVIRRHPDIKILREPHDIEKLVNQQISLLESLWPLLASNAILVYVTCSILTQENQNVIETFLKKHPDAVLQPVTLPYGLSLSAGHLLLPGQNNGDGFYYAVLSKS